MTGTSGAVGVVLVAAGSGTRLGADVPKALVPLAGIPLLAHALDGLTAAGLPAAVVVCPPGREAQFADAAAQTPVAAFVSGGATRTQSVRAGLAALVDDVEVVVIHDAARPFMPPEVMRATLRALREAGDVVAAAPALAVADTLKRTAGDTVVGTVDRSGLAAVQTPQVFPRRLLEQALSGAREATDELALVEELVRSGGAHGRVVVVPGSVWGHKITYPSDLELGEALAAWRAAHARMRGEQAEQGEPADPAGQAAQVRQVEG